MLPHKKNIKPPTRRFGVPLLATVLALSGVTAINIAMPAPAFAKSQPESEKFRTERVRYRDLNLATDEGVSRLQQRINRAAKNVCELDGVLAVVEYRAVRRCIADAQSNALNQAGRKIIQLQQLTRK